MESHHKSTTLPINFHLACRKMQGIFLFKTIPLILIHPPSLHPLESLRHEERQFSGRARPSTGGGEYPTGDSNFFWCCSRTQPHFSPLGEWETEGATTAEDMTGSLGVFRGAELNWEAQNQGPRSYTECSFSSFEIVVSTNKVYTIWLS